MNTNQKTVIAICLFLVLIIGLPFLLIGTAITRDWYRESAVSIPCFKVFQLSWAQNGGVIVRSWHCIETTNTYAQVSMWYKQHGWYCDGACESGSPRTVLGSLHFDTYKRMMPIDRDFQRSPLQIFIYQEYALTIY